MASSVKTSFIMGVKTPMMSSSMLKENTSTGPYSILEETFSKPSLCILKEKITQNAPTIIGEQILVKASFMSEKKTSIKCSSLPSVPLYRWISAVHFAEKLLFEYFLFREKDMYHLIEKYETPRSSNRISHILSDSRYVRPSVYLIGEHHNPQYDRPIDLNIVIG